MNAPSDNVIETRRLSKSFGDVHAVRALDLNVQRGEIFGFLGPNGAGKTTTIRMLLDFIRPSSGEAVVLDGSGADERVRKRIGYLPGDLHLPARYTGNELFELYAALRAGCERKRTDDLVERFGLDPTRTIGELSTGNRRKVGIVQAFMHRPELLILDEPTSGLDPLLQAEFQHLMREAVDDGATVFLSSHVLPEVDRIADRVAILRDGRLVVVSTIDELREKARQVLEFFVNGDANTAARAFEGVPGVVEVSVEDDAIRVVSEGSIDAVVKAAATIEVRRMVSLDHDLEQLFLSFYREDQPE